MSITKIQARLKELREMREKATPGEWKPEEIDSDWHADRGWIPGVVDYDGCGSHAADWKDDSREFTCFAANEWLTILDCLDKMAEALESIRQVSTEEACDDALSALTASADLLSKGKT